jgi:hypothetical protein
MPDPATLATIAAILGAMLVFAFTVLIGRSLVRVLRLPTDLPPGPRFAPPPPPARDPDTPAQARERARHHRRRVKACTDARTACETAEVLAETRRLLATYDQAELRAAGCNDPEALLQTLDQAQARVHGEAEAAECAMHDADLESACAVTAAAATTAAHERSEIDRLLAPIHLPDADRRRLWRLLIALIVAVSLCILVFALRPTP